MTRAGTSVLSFLLLAGGVSFTTRAAAQSGTSGGRASAQVDATRELLAASARPADRPMDDRDAAWRERESKLNESETMTGGVGLLHTQHAQGGAPGQFRLSFTTEYFSSGFLCSREFPCRDPNDPTRSLQSDTADHIGGRLTLSMQLVKWLDAYLGTSAIGNSNAANRPSLLQVLGDSTIGAKAHGALSNVFHVGGAFELWLVNGTGAVGLDGAGTSAKFRGLATADLRGAQKPVPLRFSTNLTYVLDNSGEVVNATEVQRGNVPITRVERFGLNVNRVDHFDVNLGAEFFAVEERVRPLIEYRVLVPVNRQGYRCRQNNPSGDKCLAVDPFAPSTLTIGSRFYPWKRGFNLTAALDIGISGVGFFIEEMRPNPPWMLYLGAGWAFDTQSPPPAVAQTIVAAPEPRGRKVRGFVHESGRSAGVAGAIVAWESHPELTSLAAGADGHFTTHELTPGSYAFTVTAAGYKPGQCGTTIVTSAPAAQDGASAPEPKLAGGDIQIDCVLEALPSVGNIVGKVKDLDTGVFVGGAAVRVVDVANKELGSLTDAQAGTFRFERVTPGAATITVNLDGYLMSTEKIDVKSRQDNPIEISVKKKPKNPLVSVQTKEIIIRQQIQFAVDSALILPSSTGLLTEIADVLVKNPHIRRVEVQGHTDTTGMPAHNMKLSEERASSVVAWLAAHGVASDRLVAKGFGDSKPLVPNVTELNKQRNRRVQFIIVDQDGVAPAAGPKTAPSNAR